MRLRRRQSFRAKPVVLWSVVFFAASQVATAIVADRKFPEHFDPEFSVRLQTLRARGAETPDRPTLLVIGSSRTVMEFRAEALPPLTTAGGQTVLPFNFSHRGAGPLVNLVQLQRLVRAGERPNWVILELMPPLLSEHHFQYLVTRHSALADLPELAKFMPIWRLIPGYLKSQLVPIYVQRHNILRATAPEWIPGGDARQPWERIALEPLGGAARWCVPTEMSGEECERLTGVARALYSGLLSQFHVDPMTDRAMRETLELCRREDIEIVLLLTPESREFRSWYTPQSHQILTAYCTALAREYGVPVIDAGDWLDDGDFYDGHHVLLHGANKFTERLGREVLVPLTAGYFPHTD